MSSAPRHLPAYTEVSENQAEALAAPPTRLYAVEVRPPWNRDVPAAVQNFLRGTLEIQTHLLGLKNSSPTIVYEIRRAHPERLQLQFCVSNKRLDRKVRTHLSNQISEIGFDTGESGLPLEPRDSIGGGIITTGKEDRYPLQTDFKQPPINGLISALHRDAMRDTRVVVQILFKPLAGHPIREWWNRRRNYKTVRFLRQDKQGVQRTRSPTPRERNQANAVEQKTDERKYWVSIRFAVIGAGDYTASRVKEIGGAFNLFENPETGQYLDIKTIRGIRQRRFLDFYRAIRDRQFGGYSLRFRATTQELAGLVSIPDREQTNIEYAQP